MSANPGRPRLSSYSPHIQLIDFVDATMEHMTPLRNYLAKQGVVVNSTGELRYAGRVEQYADAYAALAHAVLKCVIHPKPIKS